MIPKLSEKELKVLLHIEHKGGDDTPPEGMSVAGYATACDGLKARGLAYPAFMEGHEVAAVRITQAGLSWLEDWREEEKRKKEREEEQAAALVVLASIKKGWMERPTFAQVKSEFGDIGTQQGFTRYLNEQSFSKEELDGVMESLG